MAAKNQVALLDYVDIRQQLPRRAWRIGWRWANNTITAHYNGPAVADRSRAGELAQLKIDAEWHMRPDQLNADGLQYEWAVGADGEIYLCRDRGSKLWHCANSTGNGSSIPVHLILGGTQDATDIQWARFAALCEALIADHKLGGRQAVKGHREWPRGDGLSQSACPGPVISRRLSSWRDGKTLTQYQVIASSLKIRQGPGTDYPVALGGTARYTAGQTFWGDGETIGETVNGDPHWVHPVTGVGFVSRAWVRPL